MAVPRSPETYMLIWVLQLTQLQEVWTQVLQRTGCYLQCAASWQFFLPDSIFTVAFHQNGSLEGILYPQALRAPRWMWVLVTVVGKSRAEETRERETEESHKKTHKPKVQSFKRNDKWNVSVEGCLQGWGESRVLTGMWLLDTHFQSWLWQKPLVYPLSV